MHVGTSVVPMLAAMALSIKYPELLEDTKPGRKKGDAKSDAKSEAQKCAESSQLCFRQMEQALRVTSALRQARVGENISVSEPFSLRRSQFGATTLTPSA
jgi:hypothetical protein